MVSDHLKCVWVSWCTCCATITYRIDVEIARAIKDSGRECVVEQRLRNLCKRFGGVVGYRICLTHRRPPVRARAESFFPMTKIVDRFGMAVDDVDTVVHS